MKRSGTTLIISIVASLLSTGVRADITNGDFTFGLDGWVVLSQDAGGYPAGVGAGFFGYGDDTSAVFSEYDGAAIADSVLYQRFIVNGPADPATSYQSLSFYFYPEVFGGAPGETDAFYFGLTGEHYSPGDTPDSAAPLSTEVFLDRELLWDSNMGVPATGLPIIDGVTITPQSGIGDGWYHVEVGLQDGWISDTYDTWFGLTFTLESDPCDEVLSFVSLDNVSLGAAVIPAPAAATLTVVGLGCMSMVRRRKAD